MWGSIASDCTSGCSDAWVWIIVGGMRYCWSVILFQLGLGRYWQWLVYWDMESLVYWGEIYDEASKVMNLWIFYYISRFVRSCSSLWKFGTLELDTTPLETLSSLSVFVPSWSHIIWLFLNRSTLFHLFVIFSWK